MSELPVTETDFSDPAQVAIKVTRMEGAFTLLSHQVNSTMRNLTSATEALQSEVRAMQHKFDALPQIQQQQGFLQATIDRAFEAINQLALTTGNRMTDLEQEHSNTKAKVIWWSGGAAVLAVVAGTVAGIGMWYEDKLAEVEARERAARTSMLEENSKRIREVELFIARSNTESTEP